MKMTDADALLAQARTVLARYADDDAQTVVNRIDARLAADQQKGGGEVVYQVKLNGPIDAWVDTTESQFALAEDHEKRRRKLYTTPQPSIPAPAQPGVDEAMARRYLAAQKAHVSKVDAAFGRPVAGALHSDDVVAACMAGLAAAFNVPAKQDGKASGGEATVPACRRCGSTNLKNVSTKGGEGKSCVECGNFRFNGPEDAR